MNADIMVYILMGIMLLCGYIFLLHFVSGRISSKKSMPLLSVIILLVYAALAVPLVFILNQMGSPSFMLMAMLLGLSCLVLFALAYGMLRHFSELNKTMLTVFILYLLAVSYFTIFNREEGHSRAILLQFDSFRNAIRSGSLEPLQHAMLNAVMFIPIGALFPFIYPERLSKVLYVGTLGLMLSTLIESTQMFLRIGQCDVEDIVANMAGALIGALLYKLYALLFIRETGEEEDEEEEDEVKA